MIKFLLLESHILDLLRAHQTYCWFSFALAFQLFRAVEFSSLFHLCNLLIFCVLGDVALMS